MWQIFSHDNSTPFSASTQEQTFKKIRDAQFEMPIGPHVTPEIKELISQLLVVDPKKRLGSENIKSLLESPLFSVIDLDSTYEIEPDLQPRQK